jgi:hypothetical protein
MAQGTFTLFNQFKEDMAEGFHNLETDSLKLAFTTLQAGGTPTIAATDSDPRWGAGGGTNLSSSEVSGTNYTAGGNATANNSVVESAGTVTFDADNPATWTQHASGPTNIKTAVLYNDTDSGKRVIGFIDMTGDGTSAISLVDGDITVAFNASGIFTLA